MVYCCTKPVRKTGAASILLLGRAGRFGRLSDRAGFNRFSELIGRFGRLSELSGWAFTNESEYFADSEICFIFVSDFKELKLLDALQS